MPDDTKERGRHETSSNETEDRALNRRNILLGSSALVAAAAITSGALAQAQKAAPGSPGSDTCPDARRAGRSIGPQAEHPRHLRRRHRHRQHQRLQRRPDGLRDAQHRPHRPARASGSCTTTASSRCTAGRAAFLTGQHGIRTGLTKVGFPGAPMGMSQLDPSIGGLLKNLGYATGQFGKNHVGDRNESLPTVNGFDEFFGNLYHLNAEEEPELPDYPKDPAYLAKFGPRGVLKMQGDRRRRPDRRSALRQGRQADHRGHRRAHQEAHGDHRRRDLGRGHRLHEAAADGRASRSSAGSTRRACTCARTSAPSIAAATSTATASTSTA